MSGSHIPAALRRLVYERANGCCEYCLLPEAVSLAPHEVDHIIAPERIYERELLLATGLFKLAS
jgi:5-methylcytosine-specific restriction endonuclease McrA